MLYACELWRAKRQENEQEDRPLLRLALPPERERPLRLLCLGAHADDIEIGCGGSVLRLIAEVPDLVVRWVVFSGDEERATEARTSAAAFLDGQPNSRVEILRFRESYFPFEGAAIKDFFEALKGDFAPSLILTHGKGDAHQDHRLVAALTHETFRDHLVLEYEVPKYDGDLSNPNFFVPLTRRHVVRKVEFIGKHFPSQRRRRWFTDETFLALARLRGIGCNAPDGLAEAFHADKIVF
jgi:LmbE family N-acetylglucosaminyl deacetylase